jgi:uncharacterized protein (TIGR02453 family)
MPNAFSGLPRTTPRFLADLAANNRREWFAAHRAEYEASFVHPAMTMVEALAPLLHKISPDVHAEARWGGSVMRVNRDIRFAKDKRPYKDHLDLFFWEGEDRTAAVAGYFFRITPKNLVLGAGTRHLPGERLERYRAAVADPTRGRALERIVKQLRAKGYEVWGTRYARVPRGYPADHPRAELLKHDGLFAGFERPIPPEAYTPRFPAFIASHFRAMRPLQEWVVKTIA